LAGGRIGCDGYRARLAGCEWCVISTMPATDMTHAVVRTMTTTDMTRAVVGAMTATDMTRAIVGATALAGAAAPAV